GGHARVLGADRRGSLRRRRKPEGGKPAPFAGNARHDLDRTRQTAFCEDRTMTDHAMRDRLIVGLDVPTVADAGKVVRELGDTVSFYKIGYQLAFAGGLEFARDLAAEGRKVFLDMKLLDIDNTVAKGVENIVRMGMTMLTLHAYPKA